MTVDVSVVIVSHNTRDLTLACIESLYAQTPNLTLQVIVVDNASTDRSADAIRQRFEHVNVMEANGNLGFARANNLAALAAAGEYLLLLNPDTVVLDRAVERIVSFARQHPTAGLIGSRTLYGDGTLNATSCFGLPSLWGGFCRAIGLSAMFESSPLFNPEDIGGWRRDTVRAVGAVTGCCALIRRSLWEQLGGFDETFYMYSEDTDLSYRVWQSGLQCLHCPEAVIIHYGGRSETSRAGKIIKVFRARAQFMRKHWSARSAHAGERLLDLCVAVRVVCFGLLKNLRNRNAVDHTRWCEVWANRSQWHISGRASSEVTEVTVVAAPRAQGI
jgi:N-acetylglucosaminyl-diphospho-decaprenol L-rhamnosyltransferase